MANEKEPDGPTSKESEIGEKRMQVPIDIHNTTNEDASIGSSRNDSDDDSIGTESDTEMDEKVKYQNKSGLNSRNGTELVKKCLHQSDLSQSNVIGLDEIARPTMQYATVNDSGNVTIGDNHIYHGNVTFINCDDQKNDKKKEDIELVNCTEITIKKDALIREPYQVQTGMRKSYRILIALLAVFIVVLISGGIAIAVVLQHEIETDQTSPKSGPLPIDSRAHAAVLNEIKQYYAQQENQTADLNVLCSKFSSHHEFIEAFNSSDPKVYAEQIASVVDELEIEISVDDWAQFLIDLKAMIESHSKPFQIQNGLKNIAQYLNESVIWYHFLVQVYDILSEYEMQTITRKNDAITIIMQIQSVGQNDLKNIFEIGLAQLLEEKNIEVYSKVENMKLDLVKLNALKNVLQQSLAADLNVTCSSKQLTVKGYNVKISDVINQNCSDKVKFMKIFAMNRLFIDVDVDATGKELQLSMIAPTWEIIGGRQIILNGADCEAHANESAPNGVGQSANGLNGLPGKAGGPAGHLFGIGKLFSYINARNVNGKLNVSLNGCVGGPGQNGGRGANGIRGENPPNVDKEYESVALWQTNGFDFEKCSSTSKDDWHIGIAFGKTTRDTYTVRGKKGTKAGNGGDGGAGGVGGGSGTCKIIALNGASNISYLSSSDNGTIGKGGAGGAETSNGNTRTIVFLEYTERWFGKKTRRHNWFEIPIDKPGEKIPAGAYGRDGFNKDKIDQPRTLEPLNPFVIVGEYKNYVREHLKNSVRESELRRFLMDLHKEKRIQSTRH